jgi:uncharacterized membrane protein
MGAAAAVSIKSRTSSLSGLAGACGYTVFLVAGPWILIVFAIAGLSYGACPTDECASLDVFRSVVIYNFLFSLMLAGPICLPLVRLVSDDIFSGNNSSILGAYTLGLMMVSLLCCALVGPFYALLTEMTGPVKIAAIQNVLLMSATWLAAPFLGVLLDHRSVSIAFLLGAGLMLAVAQVLPGKDPAALLNDFSIGMVAINACMLRRLSQASSAPIRIERRMIGAYRRYWQLALFSLIYFLGIWVDNVIMWFGSPIGVSRVAGILATMPDYDSMMFWAQLATIPLLALFTLGVETRLYEMNRQFQLSLARHASRREIESRITALSRFVIRSIVLLFVASIVIVIMVMLASFWGMDRVGLSGRQMAMLRAGLFGVACHTTAMFCCVFMMFFDMRRAALIVMLTFFVANAVLTLAFLPLGFAYFGYGNLLAGALALMLGFLLLVKELPWLCYHTFVTNNVSLQRSS